MKWEPSGIWLPANSRVSGSVFRTDKTNAREPDPNNPLQNVLGGNQRVDGFQVSVSGHLTDRWQLLSSYALLDGEVVSSQYYPQSVGAELANVPRNTSTSGPPTASVEKIGGRRRRQFRRQAAPPAARFLMWPFPRVWLPHGQFAEGGAGLLGIQRHGQISANRAGQPASQPEQPHQQVLLRSESIPRTSCPAPVSRLWWASISDSDPKDKDMTHALTHT